MGAARVALSTQRLPLAQQDPGLASSIKSFVFTPPPSQTALLSQNPIVTCIDAMPACRRFGEQSVSIASTKLTLLAVQYAAVCKDGQATYQRHYDQLGDASIEAPTHPIQEHAKPLTGRS